MATATTVININNKHNGSDRIPLVTMITGCIHNHTATDGHGVFDSRRVDNKQEQLSEDTEAG